MQRLIYNYDPTQVVVNYGEVVIDTFTDGDFIQITRNNARTSMVKGIDGQTAYLFENGELYTISFNVFRASPVATYLMMMYQQRLKGEGSRDQTLVITDNSCGQSFSFQVLPAGSDSINLGADTPRLEFKFLASSMLISSIDPTGVQKSGLDIAVGAVINIANKVSKTISGIFS
jgi:hypothetical protein